ncbi:MAG: hypothetical protein D6826_03400 [Alphaproteobacteria bacterium]|nr:MAG: hypothetical protein D6826_03400 [Alphaproteobacteria bacterium]
MSETAAERYSTEDAIAAYKRLLKTYLDRRPSGTRQRIAAALGTHKSFVSQITNPNYRVPLPAQHVNTIMRICHFSPEEQRAFLDAYHAAHPRPAPSGGSHGAARTHVLHIEVPHFKDPARQREVMDTIRDMAARIIRLAQYDEQT